LQQAAALAKPIAGLRHRLVKKGKPMAATRETLFARFEALGIEAITVEHPPLFTVEQSKALRGDIPGAHTKNLFLKCKKDALWLVVAVENTPVDLKTLHKILGSGRLSFGSADLLREVLGVEPGSVTPFAVINDEARRVSVVLDKALFAYDRLNFHPLVNTATTGISGSDFLRFLEDCAHPGRVLPLGGIENGGRQATG
jgi:Ala-tRNA(Pro) deacylase